MGKAFKGRRPSPGMGELLREGAHVCARDSQEGVPGLPAYPRLLPRDTQKALTRCPLPVAPAEVTSATPLSLPPRWRTRASPDAPAREALRGKPSTTTSGALPLQRQSPGRRALAHGDL